MRILLAGLVAAVTLAACDSAAPRRSQAPLARPADALPPSADSAALAAYSSKVQADRLARGLLRTDGGGPDVQFTAEDLARNFGAIAFGDESAATRRGTGRLARWEGPVRLSAEFGPSVPRAQARQDRAVIGDYARRLGRITGHPVSTMPGAPNFVVLVAGEDDSAFVEARLKQVVPGITPDQIDLFVGLPRSVFCLVVAFSGAGGPDSYVRAVALIRAEHPDLMRRACIHEEIAQGFGLPNDSPGARPSIFNDDDEFALLTGHDEMLLRMLYDPRMRPGMTPAEADEVARDLARAYMGLAI